MYSLQNPASIIFSDALLEGQPNFRSLSGLVCQGGRRIKENTLFRSGSLHALTPGDLEKLEKIGLAAIIDFRSDREIDEQPSPVIHTVRERHRVLIRDVARDRAMALLKKNNPQGMTSLLEDDYRRVIRVEQEAFRYFFRLVEGAVHLPLVFHCAAGKDRTGLAAVFLLTALGASLETIRKDYFASNHYSRSFTERVVRHVNESGMNGEMIRPLMEVRESYLQAALDVMEEEYGGLMIYVRDVLNADSENLRQKYLEKD